MDLSFEKRPWVILFADLTDFAGEAVIQYAREWARRYAQYELGILVVVRPSYAFLASAESLLPIFRRSSESFPAVLDQTGYISEAFGVKEALPAVKLLQGRNILFDRSGQNWLGGTEMEIQKFLRLKDPGLPLSPAFELAGTLPASATSAEFGTRAKSPMIQITGKYLQEAERIVVNDPSAIVRFRSPSSRVSFVAASAASPQTVTRVRVELNGDTVFDAAAASDLSPSDDGGSEVKVSAARLYHALQALPERARDVSLRFPDADRLPVALYVARFPAP